MWLSPSLLFADLQNVNYETEQEHWILGMDFWFIESKHYYWIVYKNVL